jgi:hypothetical protein
MADLMERNALTNAKAQASQAQGFVDQARRVNPIIPPLLQIDIASGFVFLSLNLFSPPELDIPAVIQVLGDGCIVRQPFYRLRIPW